VRRQGSASPAGPSIFKIKQRLRTETGGSFPVTSYTSGGKLLEAKIKVPTGRKGLSRKVVVKPNEVVFGRAAGAFGGRAMTAQQLWSQRRALSRPRAVRR
jgi:hypothetical protein